MEIKNKGRLGTGYNSLLSLRANFSSPGRSSGGREHEREIATTSLEFEFQLQFPWAPRRLSCQISDNQGEAETSANVNKHWKARAKGNEIITNVISANQHCVSHRLFWYRYLNSRDVVASSPSFSRPTARAPRRACSQAIRYSENSTCTLEKDQCFLTFLK